MATGFKKATVNAAKVPSTQTNFPSYIDLSRIGITTLAEAQSVRVYSDEAKTTELAREIVSATEMHVKVPSLTSTTDIYVEYDGVSADYAVTDTYGRNAVWSGYRAVFHLDGLTDSTGNSYTLTNNNTVTLNATGKLGGSADFTSSNTNKSLSVASDLGLSTTAYTIDMWVNKYSVTAYGQGPWTHNSNTNRRYYDYYENSGGASMRFAQEGSPGKQFNLATGWSNSTWHKITQTFDNTNMYGYLDGAYGNQVAVSGDTGSVTNTFRLGSHQGGTAVASLFWQGLIDEARVSSTTNTANWITTEYNNQSDEATFWGTWSTVGGGGGANTTNFFLMA